MKPARLALVLLLVLALPLATGGCHLAICGFPGTEAREASPCAPY